MDRLMDLVRQEFEKIIMSKVQWGRREIMFAFDQAWIFGMARYAKEKGIDLT